jgi:ferritin-like metal-binding protein YciE
MDQKRRPNLELNSLEKLYVEQLKDIYSAEKQLVKALPKMAKKASSAELTLAFEEHLEVTKNQVERLERLFDRMEKTPRGKKCMGMEGLIKEGEELMGEDADEETLDAGLIAAAQKVEHYEIAAYGTVRTYAEMLGDTHAARELERSLEEEKQTDQRLNKLALSTVNIEAL